MKNQLRDILTEIARNYKENIDSDSRFYIEVSVAQKGAEMGFSDGLEPFKNVRAIVPLKHPLGGMKVRIDGRTFKNYAQFESGIVVPDFIAGQVDWSHKTYVAKDSMIYNFS